MNIISIRKCIVDTDDINDVTYMRQSVITSVICFYDTTLSTEYDKDIFYTRKILKVGTQSHYHTFPTNGIVWFYMQ